jgi:16S rRNA (guanine527-N7)-methyltransferase
MEIIEKYFTSLSSAQKQQFQKLKELYHFWNAQINVISRKDIESLYEKHILHSLAIAKVCAMSRGMKIVDIGTGGGFPGIPLAILFPEAEFLLVDSIGKKIKVVQGVIEEAGLNNAKARHCRAEDIRKNNFDLCVSRAVAPLSKLWEWSKPLLIAKGNQGLICLKGGDLTTEIKASGLKPRQWPISDFFREPFFENKFILWAG